MTNIHCPIIHGGLRIDLKYHPTEVYVNNCCLRDDIKLTDQKNVWLSETLIPLREINDSGQWDKACWSCQGNELAGTSSFRTGMLSKFGIRQNLSGPTRLDLMFDISCNLACRSCGPGSSTYWQRHLKENNIQFSAPPAASRVDDMIEILRNLDLSNLGMVVFCGGETLLGQGYWRIAELLTEIAPAEQITLCFQTNGTQPISERNYRIIEKFELVKLHVSVDGIGDRFEYLRWPAKWKQVVDNLNDIIATAPTNVMFLIEETVSIFNLFYQEENTNWIKQNFSTNRLGDAINHTKHVAHGIFSLDQLSQEYVEALRNTQQYNLVHPHWQETPHRIKEMLVEIEKFDTIRGQDWHKIFPEVAEFYKRFETSGR